MGTNYYRVPTDSEMQAKKTKLIQRIHEMELSPENIERNFSILKIEDNDWESQNPWDEFMQGASVHLGKRSSGWKFSWNFHEDKYYHNKETLLAFIRAGRVVDECGDEQDVEEFIQMALDWGQPDGWIHDEEYERTHTSGWRVGSSYYDRIVDGLRVSFSTDFI